MKDYRTIPIEVLRDFARSQAEAGSIRGVAEEVGLSHSALHKFILGHTNPQPRVRRLLGLWYLRVTGGEDEEAQGFASAFDTLLAGVPDGARSDAARALLDVLESGYAAGGAGAPEWRTALRNRESGG